ncbi:MAG: SagB/ThcOx family dehydrogenase [Nitrospiraceae bacterium]|nr:MAG: SagB/ThcOx family dehydrogenase [Nitrospiraceae bacterium]
MALRSVKVGLNDEQVTLPKLRYESTTSVEQALLKRRSVREFRNLPLALDDLGQLLWAAQGITDQVGFRTAPSAGALYPLEVYACAGNAQGLPTGLYRYIPRGHALRRIADGDKRPALGRAAYDQPLIAEAPAVLALCAVYERVTGKYGERGLRYVHMEAGHAAQNVYLHAVTLNLGTVVLGAFDDRRVAETLTLGEQDQPLYLMPIGRT